MTFPDFELVLLRRVHRPAHDLKNVRGGAAMAVLHTDGDTDHHGGTEIAGSVRWNRGDQPTVRKTARADLDRFEQAREGATRADGVHQIALREHHGFAGVQVRGRSEEHTSELQSP